MVLVSVTSAPSLGTLALHTAFSNKDYATDLVVNHTKVAMDGAHRICLQPNCSRVFKAPFDPIGLCGETSLKPITAFHAI